MDMIKKYLPHAFAADTQERMIGAVIIYVAILVVGLVVSWLIGTLLGWIPLIGIVVGLLLKIAGIIIDVYAVAGIVLTLLVYFKVLK
ncbi:MAG: hypothetical protein IKB58_04515 [Oscillospiraceae bacterium]|nr:hypothetical protein [Oscillospiraceae bacterium]